MKTELIPEIVHEVVASKSFASFMCNNPQIKHEAHKFRCIQGIWICCLTDLSSCVKLKNFYFEVSKWYLSTIL